MFRELVRKKQQISKEECIQLLKEELRGVLSVQGDDGYPYGLPINHYYNVADGCLYFHSGMTGHKIDAIRRDSKASFCVYNRGFRREGEWALNIKSVIVFGRVEIIEDKETIYEMARKLSHKFTRDDAYIEKEITHSGSRTLLFRLVPEHMTGKLVNES